MRAPRHITAAAIVAAVAAAGAIAIATVPDVRRFAEMKRM
jgi:hypothetical protein